MLAEPVGSLAVHWGRGADRSSGTVWSGCPSSLQLAGTMGGHPCPVMVTCQLPIQPNTISWLGPGAKQLKIPVLCTTTWGTLCYVCGKLRIMATPTGPSSRVRATCGQGWSGEYSVLLCLAVDPVAWGHTMSSLMGGLSQAWSINSSVYLGSHTMASGRPFLPLSGSLPFSILQHTPKSPGLLSSPWLPGLLTMGQG